MSLHAFRANSYGRFVRFLARAQLAAQYRLCCLGVEHGRIRARVEKRRDVFTVKHDLYDGVLRVEDWRRGARSPVLLVPAPIDLYHWNLGPFARPMNGRFRRTFVMHVEALTQAPQPAAATIAAR